MDFRNTETQYNTPKNVSNQHAFLFLYGAIEMLFDKNYKILGFDSEKSMRVKKSSKITHEWLE